MRRIALVLVALSVCAGCSFKYLQTVDDTESAWRPVQAPPAAPDEPPPPPMTPDVGY